LNWFDLVQCLFFFKLQVVKYLDLRYLPAQTHDEASAI